MGEKKEDEPQQISPDELIERMNAIARVSGLIAHDINNYMQPLLINLQFISDEIDDNHPAKNDLDDCFEVVNQAATFIDKLFKSTKHINLNIETHPVAEIAEELEQVIKDQIPDRILYQKSLQTLDGKVDCDLPGLREVATIILENALDHMPEAGKFEFRVDEFGDLKMLPEKLKQKRIVKFSFADDGRGWDAERLNRRFELFNTGKNYHEGHGMDLTKSFMIIDKMSGYLDVVSSIGQGCTISIYLPLLK